MIKKILFPFYNAEKHGFLMNKWFFRVIFSLFIFIIGCCLVFIPLDSYNDYSVREKIRNYFSDYLEHYTSNVGRFFLSIGGADEEGIKILSDAGVLRVFGIYCDDPDCVYQGYGKDYTTKNYYTVLDKARYDPDSVKNINQFVNRGTSLLRKSNFSEIAKVEGNDFLQKYKQSYLNALDKLDGVKEGINIELMNDEMESYSSKNKYRNEILQEIKTNRKHWKWFKTKTRTIAVIKPIVTTILVYYAIQLVFLLWFVNFIILGGKNKDKNSSPKENTTINNKPKKKSTSKKAK